MKAGKVGNKVERREKKDIDAGATKKKNGLASNCHTRKSHFLSNVPAQPGVVCVAPVCCFFFGEPVITL